MSMMWICACIGALLLVQQTTCLFYQTQDQLVANIIGVGALSGAATSFALTQLTCGKDCIKKCEVDKCGPNGKCIEFDNHRRCICDPGFQGTVTCEPVVGSGVCTARPCGPNGYCVATSDAPNGYVCVCKFGFVFNAAQTTCVADACNGVNCGFGIYSECVVGSSGAARCICPEGYAFDGTTCFPQCPVGTVEFKYMGGKICYYAVYSEQDRVASVDVCKNANRIGELAIIPSQEAQDFISGPHFSFKDFTNKGFWISANDMATEGTFVDIKSDPIRFENWDLNWDITSQPNGGTAENCVAAFPHRDYTWQDKPCTDRLQALCSVNIGI